MQKFVQSGGAFIVVALLCMAVGFISRNGAVFASIGAFWLIMAIIVRARSAKKPSGDKS
jgi:succinate-acetate transporter protein